MTREKELRFEILRVTQKIERLVEERKKCNSLLHQVISPFECGDLLVHKKTGERIRFIRLDSTRADDSLKWMVGYKIKKNGEDYQYSTTIIHSYEEYEKVEEK